MKAFEVRLNGKKLCIAGIGRDGVLNAVLGHVVGDGREELDLGVGGLISPTNEYIDWVK